MNRISLSYVRSSRGWVAVSTIRLTERWATCMPKYETLVFAARKGGGKITSWRELDGSRYETFADARAGHSVMVARWGKYQPNRVPPPAHPQPRVRRA